LSPDRPHFLPGWAHAAAAGVVCLAGCSSTARDVVPVSRDLIVDGGAPPQSPESYEYVARRPLGAVALAEARGIESAAARRAIDHLADALDRCAAERGSRGGLIGGAARVIVRIASDGEIAGAQLKMDPGLASGATETAVLCLLAPVKMLGFPAIDSGTRGFAIEAIWGSPT
jgi:hypothetical protein